MVPNVEFHIFIICFQPLKRQSLYKGQNAWSFICIQVRSTVVHVHVYSRLEQLVIMAL